MFHRASKPIRFSPPLPSESLVFVFHGKKMTQIAEYNKDCKHVLQVLGLHMEPHVYLVPLLLIFVYSNCLHYEKKETPKRQVVKLIDFILRTNICEKRFERKKKNRWHKGGFEKLSSHSPFKNEWWILQYRTLKKYVHMLPLKPVFLEWIIKSSLYLEWIGINSASMDAATVL